MAQGWQKRVVVESAIPSDLALIQLELREIVLVFRLVFSLFLAAGTDTCLQLGCHWMTQEVADLGHNTLEVRQHPIIAHNLHATLVDDAASPVRMEPLK